MADRRCLWQVEILNNLKVLDFLSLNGRPSLPPAGRYPQKNEGLALVKPLWRTVVASKSSTLEGLGFSKPPWLKSGFCELGWQCPR